jgi:exonuclease III
MLTIPQAERGSNPQDQYIKDLTAHIAQLKRKDFQVILLGDMNINTLKTEPHIRQWKEQIEILEMHNVLDIRGGQHLVQKQQHGRTAHLTTSTQPLTSCLKAPFARLVLRQATPSTNPITI